MRILLINLPPYVPKKPGNDLYFAQRSLNLGLLAVGSSARRDGHDVVLYDWLGPAQADLLADLEKILANVDPHIVGFSVPSGYAEEYLQEYTECIRAHSPKAIVVVGGQYHAGARGQALLRRFPNIDHVVSGLADGFDWNSIAHSRRKGLRSVLSLPPNSSDAGSQMDAFDWTLHGFDLRQYAPKIEIGRGCPFKCSFCAISGAPARLTRAAISAVRTQLEFWDSLWRSRTAIPLYVECPVFFCSKASISDYEICFSDFKDRFFWRAAARVDSIEPTMLDRLRAIGLTVLDIGLESGSSKMLQLMNKTNKPTDYLKRAKRLITAAGAAGIKVKLNILFYAGETPDTISATEDFIDYCMPHVYGVSVGSLIDYPGTVLRDELPDFRRRFGTERVLDPVLRSADVYPLHLSRTMDYNRAQALCIKLSQSVMSAEQYYSLKSVGYYPPAFSFSEFQECAQRCDPSTLPFNRGTATDGHVNESPGTFLPRWDVLR